MKHTMRGDRIANPYLKDVKTRTTFDDPKKAETNDEKSKAKIPM